MKTALLILISLFFYTNLYAQEQPSATGQICVRAFEDINSNQIRDQGEIPIQQNLIANLLDAQGVIINSALIEESATRSQGLICFRDLAPNTYTVSVDTVAYQPTTDQRLTVTLADGDLPVVLEFGGSSIFAETVATSADETPTPDPTLERFVVSGIGALTAMVVWVMLGVVIGFFIMRPKQSSVSDKTNPRANADPDAIFKPPSAQPPDDTYEF